MVYCSASFSSNIKRQKLLGDLVSFSFLYRKQIRDRQCESFKFQSFCLSFLVGDCMAEDVDICKILV